MTRWRRRNKSSQRAEHYTNETRLGSQLGLPSLWGVWACFGSFPCPVCTFLCPSRMATNAALWGGLLLIGIISYSYYYSSIERRGRGKHPSGLSVHSALIIVTFILVSIQLGVSIWLEGLACRDCYNFIFRLIDARRKTKGEERSRRPVISCLLTVGDCFASE